VPTDYDGMQQEQQQLSSVHRVTLFDKWRGVGRRRKRTILVGMKWMELC
jgi:hypothetical protein